MKIFEFFKGLIKNKKIFTGVFLTSVSYYGY